MARPRKYPLPVTPPEAPEGVYVGKLAIVSADWRPTLREHDIEIADSQAVVVSGSATIDDVSYSDGTATIMLTPTGTGNIVIRVTALGSDGLTRSQKVSLAAAVEPAQVSEVTE